MSAIVAYGYVLAILAGLNATSRDQGDGRLAWWMFALALAAITYWLDSNDERDA